MSKATKARKATNFSNLYNLPQLPETVVLAINTHGYIVLDETTHEPEIFTPEGIEIVKIAAVVPGVCNILSPSTVTQNIKLVSELTTEFCKDKNINDVDLEGLGNYINETLKYNQHDFSEIEKSVRQTIARGESVDNVSADHVHASDKGFQIKNFSNTPMINKWYMRSNSDIAPKHHDWKMAIVNLHGAKIDFMPYVSRDLRSGDHSTNIQKIIDTLKGFGVKRLLVVDFSCSNFTDIERNDIVVDTREMNVIQRNLLKEELFGGRIKENKSKENKSKENSRVKQNKPKHNKSKHNKTKRRKN